MTIYNSISRKSMEDLYLHCNSHVLNYKPKYCWSNIPDHSERLTKSPYVTSIKKLIVILMKNKKQNNKTQEDARWKTKINLAQYRCCIPISILPEHCGNPSQKLCTGATLPRRDFLGDKGVSNFYCRANLGL